MTELVRCVRQDPGGARTESVLTGGNGRFVLAVDGADRDLPGGDLVSALSGAPELTRVTAGERIEITCADTEVREQLVAPLRDPDPLEPFDEDAWPTGTDLPPWDEGEVDALLSRRWLTIDGDEYHLLALGDRTRAVRYDADLARIESGELLVEVHWSFEHAMIDGSGTATLRLVGGDALVAQSTGEIQDPWCRAVDAGTLPSAVAGWLDDGLYGTAFVLAAVELPGLTDKERTVLLGECSHHEFALGLTIAQRAAVVDVLCADGPRQDLRAALAAPDSPAGTDVHARLRRIVDGDEAMIEFLEDHV